MPDQVYLERDAKKYGPFSTAQVKKLVASGRVQLTDLLWKEGMGAGVPAAKIKMLFPDAPAAVRDAAAGPASPPAATGLPPQTPLPVRHSSPPSAHANGPAASPEPSGYQMPDDAALLPVGAPTDWELAAEGSPAPPQATGPTAPDKPVAPPSPPVPRKETVRKRRAVVVSGAVIVNQDGTVVRYRKKCTKCGQEDGNTASMPIPSGMTRASFFCPKCRKLRDVQIQGMS